MKILVVEDLRAVAALMEARLVSFGHEVILAQNGLIAVEKFCEFQPDLVFMDIEMPVMNGFEATNRIRAFEATQQWAWTPIIFLTASDTPDNLVTAIEAGGDDFLVKGITENVLDAKMKAMSRIAAMRQQLSVVNKKLQEQASRDGLTGLFNRRWMDVQVDAGWSRCVSNKLPFALLMLDIDNFKKYNDHYGHQAGDDCLRKVADALEWVVLQADPDGEPSEAFVARYGGEEFAVVIPDASELIVEHLAREIVDAVRKLAVPHALNDSWGIATISVGCARMEVAAGEVVQLFRNADAALYRAKDGGRNRYEHS